MEGHNRLPSKLHQLPIPSTILEDRIVIQQREIQTLFRDNQQLTATHLILKQDLSLIEDEIRCLKAAAATLKAKRDDEVRVVYERSLKLDSEVRSIDALRGQLAQVRDDVERLAVHRQELATQLRAINGEIAEAKMEAEQARSIKAELQKLEEEIQRGRLAIEYEKKLNASNTEHGETMEQNMVAVAHEIEKLHIELGNAGNRSRVEAVITTEENSSKYIYL